MSMRAKEQILANYEDDVSYHKGGNDLNPAIQGHILLEVLIDIRDALLGLDDRLSKLYNIQGS